jgi:hypothetical protein
MVGLHTPIFQAASDEVISYPDVLAPFVWESSAPRFSTPLLNSWSDSIEFLVGSRVGR